MGRIVVEVRGVPLELHPSPDYLSDHIRRTGDFYEADILDYLAVKLRDVVGVAVDAGAMIGNHAAYLGAFLPFLEVHAFEPEPENYRLLQCNAPKATTHRVALSDHEGYGSLYNHDHANLGHWQISTEVIHPVIIMRRLDQYALRDVRLIKLDVEGHEPQVLKGAEQTIARWKPLLLVEDWDGGMHIPGYHAAMAWPSQQTYLYEPD